MNLEGTKTQANLMGGICRRERGPQQVHVLCF